MTAPSDGRVDTRPPKPKPVVTEVTFKDFQRLMIKRNVDDLVDIFRGRLEDTTRFFRACHDLPVSRR